MKMKRRDLLAVGVAGTAAAAGIAWSLLRRPADTDTPADALWRMSFPQPQGGTLVMTSLHGRPLLLNFWATWCAPCVKEMPLLDQFHREHRGAGWQVVGLAVDTPGPVSEFLARVPVEFAIAIAGLDGAALSRQLGNDAGGLPYTVVFDPSGRIHDRKLGVVTPGDLARWANAMKASIPTA
jgi:thiol-disulfide isomerase/thioredoxin